MTAEYRQGTPKTLTIVNDRTLDACIGTFRNAVYGRTDALGVMLNNIDPVHKNEKDIRQLLAYAGSKPVLAMNYRDKTSERGSADDDQLVDLLLTSIRAGADMCALMGDLFDRTPAELTTNQAAIDKQKRTIDQVHQMGGKVLMSSHNWNFMNTDETITHFKALESRGGDLVKIAMAAYNEEQLEEVFRTTLALRHELKVPYIFICMGQYGKRHRLMGPMLGTAYALCVQEYTDVSHREQILLRSARAVYDSVDWEIARDTTLGTANPYVNTGAVADGGRAAVHERV